MKTLPGAVARCAWGVVLLLGCGGSSPETSLHRAIRLGKSLETLRPVFEEGCAHLEEVRYTDEMAAPFDEQTQVNCSGLEILGARRDVEFLFNDGPLGHVWILIEPEEATSMLTTLEKIFGEVVYETEGDRVLPLGPWRCAARPEILVGAPDIITALTGYRGGDG